jgi:hypothetical protein
MASFDGQHTAVTQLHYETVCVRSYCYQQNAVCIHIKRTVNMCRTRDEKNNDFLRADIKEHRPNINNVTHVQAGQPMQTGKY